METPTGPDGGVLPGQGHVTPYTVPIRPIRMVIVIKGSARRIFGQVSSVIRGSAAVFDLCHQILEVTRDEYNFSYLEPLDTLF